MEVQASIFDEMPKYKITKPVRLIELFAGIGAQAKALERLNIAFDRYKMCEFDRQAVLSYNAIHGTNFEPTDIRRWKGDDLCIVDTDKYEYILTYSFPCTDLSTAGQMKGMRRLSGTRSGLLWEVERILKETKQLPQVLLMENVPQVCAEKNISDWEEWLKFLTHIGYKNFYKILNAKDYGVPQNRERCFMVSILNGRGFEYEFPKPRTLEKSLFDIVKFDKKYMLKEENMTKMQRQNIEECAIKIETEIAKTIRVGGAASFDKKHNFDIYSVDLQTRKDFCRVRRGGSSKTVLAQHDLFYTINGRQYYIYSPLESILLMDFDEKDYMKIKKAGVSDRNIKKQAGNSIVVSLLVEIFKELF